MEQATLRVLINQIDYTVAPPGALDNTSLPRVPVIRIYGASSTGQKACVHVHQVYPYFFVEYGGKLSPSNVSQYIAKLSRSLNHAIAISMKRNPHSSNSQFVRAVLLVKGIHFYGFHSSYTPFLKILIADPAFVNRAVTILQSGTVMRTRFRVYESHLSYILQFMCDFGLYGCGWINFAAVWQRGHEENDIEMIEQSTFKVSPHFRQSRMPLEVDVAAHQILNRRLLSARNIHHKLAIPAPPLPAEPVVLSVRELWDDERRRRLAQGLAPTPVLPLDSSKMSRDYGGEWVAEARWWEELRKRIEKERDTEPTMTDRTELWEKWVMTTFESVEALWEPEWRTWKPDRGKTNGHTTLAAEAENVENPFAQATQDGVSINQKGPPQSMDVDVDEMLLSTQEMSQMMDRGDEEWADLQEGDTIAEPDDTAVDAQFLEEEPPPDSRTDAHNPCGEAEVTTDMDESDSPSRSHPPSPVQYLSHSRASRKRTRSVSLSDPPETPTKKTRYMGHEAAHDATTPTTNALPLKIPTEHRAASPDSSDSSDKPSIEENPFYLRDDHLNVSRTPKNLQGSKMSNQVGSPVLRTSAVVGDSVQRAEHTFQPSLPKASFSTQMSYTSSSSTAFSFAAPPPSSSELLRTIEVYGLSRRVYRNPYYSRRADAPEHPREYAGLLYHLKGGDGLDTLEEWKSHESQLHGGRNEHRTCMSWGWEYAALPPSKIQVKKWLKENPVRLITKTKMHSQVEGSTQMNPYGVKSMPYPRTNSNSRAAQHMSLFSLEVFAPSRDNKVPDANVDGVVAIFFALGDDDIHSALRNQGILAVNNAQLDPSRIRGFPLEIVADELELLNRIIDIVVEFDPDIIVGWDVQSASWGYLNARGNYYGFDIGELISRAPSKNPGAGNDSWSQRTTTTFKVTGRHVFNVWRIMRVEQTLSMYSFENVAFHLLRRRVPRYTAEVLTTWYNSTDPMHISRVLRYFLERTIMTLEILQEAETTTKNAEFARVFGVDFYSVISRGSQFKVESFMFRIAKPESFVLLSPSKQDVGKQNAAECMPLIMEPLSAFYNGPLVVLDFQSLYPSIMIAYNYCYSTCLGRIFDFQGRNKFGVVDLQRPSGFLEKLQDHITVAPNGIMYVKPEVRKGLLGRMLTELLDTRVMVKQAMKVSKSDKALSRVLDARQLGLKYIANVTYGYTSATYSGRMPAVEIADSIVQSGRETLEKAIQVIDSTAKWGARVVYGDTDSLFIYLHGKTKEQAFQIGYNIADTITAMNPAPIKLKFEKVYLPCVLMAKKRYVGFKFESPDETVPIFDAKGIETVRRDGVPAQSKMTETCLKILFRTQDLSQVKDYCYQSWTKILQDKASIQDFIFAKEVKMGTYSEKAPPPPGVAVAARRMMEDENDEVQYGDRIPYVIIRGGPQARLVDRAVSPEELLQNKHMHLDTSYYISRILIPPLERVFNLVGADVRSWFDDMPKAIRANHPNPLVMSPKKQRFTANRFKIDEHFQSSQCLACGGSSSDGICDNCRGTPRETMPSLLEQIRKGEARLLDAQRVCASCTSTANAEPIECMNIDCPWLFNRKKAERKTELLEGLGGIMDELEILEDHGILSDSAATSRAHTLATPARLEPEYLNDKRIIREDIKVITLRFIPSPPMGMLYEQILSTLGIAAAPIPHYLNTNTNQDISIPLGISIGLLASFVQSLGLAIQRRSHVLNSQLSEQDQKIEHRRPLWLIGFAIFMTSNILGSFIQIASLPVVILAPLGAVSLLWNALFARLLLRPRMLLGTALIAGGAALIAIYGIVPETTRSLDELMALFARPAFIGWFCAEGFVLLVCLLITHYFECSYQRQLDAAAYSLLQANRDSPLSSSSEASTLSSPPNSPAPLPPTTTLPSNLTTSLTEELATGGFPSEVTPLLDPKIDPLSSVKSKLTATSTPHAPIPGRTPLLLALAYAAASGTLSGLCLIFAKSGVELLVLTFRGINQFYRWEAWILVGGLIVFALGQLWYLNRGLRLADPAFVCPSAFCFYNFSSIINGLVYFNQLGQLPGWHLILVIVGMFVLLAGVWAVSAQASVDESDIATEFDIEDQTASERRSVSPEINPHAHHPSYASTAVRHLARTDSFTPGLTAPPMKRQVRSEGAIFPQSSLSLHTLHEPSSQRPSPSNHQTDVSPLSPVISPSRHRPNINDLSASIHTIASSLHQQHSSSVISPAGLTIGLSPVSPGFGPARRPSRHISGVGHGFAAVVTESMSLTGSAGDRRRTLSLGHERHFEDARDRGEWSGPHAEVSQQEMRTSDGTASGDGESGTRGRWKLLRDIFLQRNARFR